MGDLNLITTNGVSAPAKEEQVASSRPRLSAFSDNVHVNITFKKSQHDVEVDLDKLSWSDALQLKRYRKAVQDGTATEEEAEGLLNAIVEKVTGRDPMTLPMVVVNSVVEAIFAQDAQRGESEKN